MYPPMRRKNRELEQEKAYAILKDAEYGILCISDEEEQPYGIPINFVLLENTIYFHCALKGNKINTLRHNSKTCFTVVGATEPVFDGSFSTYYESVMAFGVAKELSDEMKKEEILTSLCMKYLPEYKYEILGEIQREMKATSVWGISIEHITGKNKPKS